MYNFSLDLGKDMYIRFFKITELQIINAHIVNTVFSLNLVFFCSFTLTTADGEKTSIIVFLVALISVNVYIIF